MEKRLRKFAEIHFGMYPGESWGDLFWSAVMGLFAVFAVVSVVLGLIFN